MRPLSLCCAAALALTSLCAQAEDKKSGGSCRDIEAQGICVQYAQTPKDLAASCKGEGLQLSTEACPAEKALGSCAMKDKRGNAVTKHYYKGAAYESATDAKNGCIMFFKGTWKDGAAK